jgi:hypothetical protein
MAMLLLTLPITCMANFWLLDPGYYFAIKDVSGTIAAGLSWGQGFTLHHEMTDPSKQVSVLYADPGIFYKQTVSDPELSLKLTQTWRIEKDSWKISITGEFDFVPIEPVNIVFCIAMLSGTIEYEENK